MRHGSIDFDEHLEEIRASIRDVEGWLSNREVDFLALLAACPTASGRIVELGSYHGKSTIVLARSAAISDRASVVTVDCQAGRPLRENLERAGVSRRVDVHRRYSAEFVARWQGPIRLLWHDGGNARDVVRGDVAALTPFLADGAIVALHDVLNTTGERIAVFVDQILGCQNFAFSGVCGSIGWAQFRRNPRDAASHWRRNAGLRRRLKRLVPFQVADQPPPKGLLKLGYKLLRSRVPHRRVAPAWWLRNVYRGSA